jgi:hypothetical protein
LQSINITLKLIRLYLNDAALRYTFSNASLPLYET